MIFVIEYINSLVIDIIVVGRLEYNINITCFFFFKLQTTVYMLSCKKVEIVYAEKYSYIPKDRY